MGRSPCSWHTWGLILVRLEFEQAQDLIGTYSLLTLQAPFQRELQKTKATNKKSSCELLPDSELSRATVIHPNPVPIHSPATATHATCVAQLTTQCHPSPALIDRTTVVPKALGFTNNSPTTAATTPTTTAPTTATHHENRPATIPHPDAAAITISSPRLVLPTWRIA